MKRLITRFAIMGIFLGISWAIYQISDLTDCSGPRAEAWDTASANRLEALMDEYDSITAYTTLTQYGTMADHAEDRYHAQINQDHPSCLNELQELVVEVHYYEWQTYEAASKNDFDSAAYYEDELFRSFDSALREFDRLEAKYDW